MIMITSQIFAGTIYYVDATNGSDSNSGTSSTATWKTINKVNNSSFNPGDSILFKKGEIWREQLVVPSSGSIGNPITFGAFGSGDKPIISGSDVFTSWTYESGIVYLKGGITIEPNILYYNNTRLTENDRATSSVGSNEWDWDYNLLYVNVGENPDYGILEAVQRDYCITGTEKSYITIENLQCQYSNKHLIAPQAYSNPSSNWTIQKCTVFGCPEMAIVTISWWDPNRFDNININNNTVSDFGASGTVGRGIEVRGADSVLIYDNNVTLPGISCDDYSGGIRYRTSSDSDTGSSIYRNTITGELPSSNYDFGILIEDTHYVRLYENHITCPTGVGIWFDETEPGERDSSTHCKIYRNYVVPVVSSEILGSALNLEAGASFNEVYYNIFSLENSSVTSWFTVLVNNGSCSNKIYNNVIITANGNDCLTIGTASDSDQTNNNLVKNNIFYIISGTSAIIVRVDGPSHAGSGNLLDYNLYNTEFSDMIIWYGNHYNTVAAFNAAQSQEANAVVRNPLFVDYYDNKYALKETSPCIDAGTDVGLTEDYDGYTVPNGWAVDIGAYEYQGSVSPPLSAEINASPTSGYVPLAVSFTGSESGGTAPYSYSWNFGDGSSSSTDQNPSHTYSEEGDYTVIFTVTDDSGQQDTDSIIINASEEIVLLEASCSAFPAEGEIPFGVTFTANASGGTAPYTYSWDFGDGSSSSDQNPSHTYSSAGNYNVTLTVTDSSSSQATDSLIITATSLTSALSGSASASTTSGQVPLSVSFTASASGGTAPYTYSWNFGDGQSSSSQNPAHTYFSAGNFTVALTVTDSKSSTATDSLTINVQEKTTSLQASASASPTSGQVPLTVSFTGSASGGTTPYAYSWNFGDGSSSSDKNPSHTYSSAGTYTVTLTVTDSSSSQATDSLIITATSSSTPLSASASASTTSGEAPLTVNFTGTAAGGISPYTYSWNFGDGTSSTEQNPSHTYTQAGTYTATLTVTDSASSQASASSTITTSSPVHEVTAPDTPEGPSTGSPGISYTYTTGGSSCSQGHSVEYYFDWGDGTYSSWASSTSASHSWSAAGTYAVKVQARCSVNPGVTSLWSEAKTVSLEESPNFQLYISSATDSPATGQGGSTNPDTGSYPYPAGNTAQVTALPATNYRFSKWTGDISGSDSYNSEITFNMDQDKSISALFCTQCGDVNGDLSITPADAQYVFEMFLGIISSATETQKENADVNCDGTAAEPNITPADAQAIFEKFLGISELPGDCSCRSRADASSAAFTQNDQSQTASLEIQPGMHNIQLSIDDIDARFKREITVPVRINNPFNIKSFGFDLIFDSGTLEFAGIEIGSLLNGFTMVDANEISEGVVRVGGFSSEPILTSSPSVLVRLKFRVLGRAKEPSPLSITNTVDDIKNAATRSGVVFL